MKVNKIFSAILWIAFAALWCGGVASYLFIGGPPAGSAWTAPAFLLIGALLTLSLTPPGCRWQLPVAGVLGMAAEYAGLKWGFPFGVYSYTKILYPSVLGVPVAIGCAWLILFAYVRQMLAWLKVSDWMRLAIGALWMTALDLLIDPLASGPLGYWFWADGGRYYGVPGSNFAGWFIVSLCLFLAFRSSPAKDRRAPGVGFSILLFFTLIAVGQRMTGPLTAGAVLLALHAGILLADLKGRQGAAGKAMTQLRDRRSGS